MGGGASAPSPPGPAWSAAVIDDWDSKDIVNFPMQPGGAGPVGFSTDSEPESTLAIPCQVPPSFALHRATAQRIATLS
jgi:hypothetical protein